MGKNKFYFEEHSGMLKHVDPDLWSWSLILNLDPWPCSWSLILILIPDLDPWSWSLILTLILIPDLDLDPWSCSGAGRPDVRRVMDKLCVREAGELQLELRGPVLVHSRGGRFWPQGMVASIHALFSCLFIILWSIIWRSLYLFIFLLSFAMRVKAKMFWGTFLSEKTVFTEITVIIYN